jgi:hypothetical protein
MGADLVMLGLKARSFSFPSRRSIVGGEEKGGSCRLVIPEEICSRVCEFTVGFFFMLTSEHKRKIQQ